MVEQSSHRRLNAAHNDTSSHTFLHTLDTTACFSELLELRIAVPCCFSGGFLVRLLQRSKLYEIQSTDMHSHDHE
jgi:hypothetical protein